MRVLPVPGSRLDAISRSVGRYRALSEHAGVGGQGLTPAYSCL